MAEIPVSIVKDAWGVHTFIWLALTEADIGEIIGPEHGTPLFSDMTAHIFGTFGASGSMELGGSGDGVNFLPVEDSAKAALGTITVATLTEILQNPRYFRPDIVAGTGVSLNLYLTAVGDLKK